MGADASKQAKPSSSNIDSSLEATNTVSSNYADMVTVLVGAAEDKFVVHEDLICAAPTLFEAVMTTKEWRELNERMVRLPEHQSMVFKVYLESIYNPKADLRSIAAIHSNELQRTGVELENMTGYQQFGLALLELTILGDYLVDIPFRNRIMAAAFEAFKDGGWTFSETAVKLAFEHLSDDSGMQMFCADWLAREIDTRPTKEADLENSKESTSARCTEPWLRAKLRSRKMELANYLEYRK